MNLLKLPSQKVFAQHLAHASRIKTTDPSEDQSSSWWCQLPRRSFTIAPTVWVQGIIVDIQSSGSTVLIDDGTGIIILTSCDKVHLNFAISKGMYIMAVGSFTLRDKYPVIKPFKLQDLSGTENAEVMWPLEVIDQLNFLNS